MTGIDNGLVNVVYDNSLNGLCRGLMGQHQQISEVDTFIFTIQTTSTKTVQLPLLATGTYNFWVDWGDGIKDYVKAYAQIYSGETVARTHTYPTALRNYTIKIKGTCKGWNYFNVSVAEQQKVTSIKRFGCLELIDDVTNGSYFSNCYNLDLSNVDDTLKTSKITNMFQAFNNILNNDISFINNWDVSNVTNMGSMFYAGPRRLRKELGSWNVSNVTNMGSMFFQCTNFNSDISQWKVNSVTNMSQMFMLCTTFNQDISIWNVAAVTNMTEMFRIASLFNQPIGSWNVGAVTSMNNMFQQCPAFDQNIGNWNVSNVTNFTSFMVDKTPATFSTTNLDAIYNGWIANGVKPNILISFGIAKYTAASTEGKALLTRTNTSIFINGAYTFSGPIIINTASAHSLVTGNKVFISGVGGTVEANGLWTVTYISSVQLQLQGSTFVNTYTVGGELTTGWGWTITDGGI
jgi:surface protein